MSDDRYYIAKDNFSLTDEEGRSINVCIGNQFQLVEDLHDQNLKVKCIDSSLSELNELVLPLSILEDMSKPNPRKLPSILRSQSAAKERICSLNEKLNEAPEKFRLSTFGHGTLPEGMSRSTYDSNRSRTLPMSVAIKEKPQPDALLDGTKTDDADVVDNVAVMRKTRGDNHYEVVTENGQDIHVDVNTGDRWLSAIDSSGQKYFYKEKTRESAWILPGDTLTLERSFGHEAVKPIEEVLENVVDSSDNEVSWNSDLSDEEEDQKVDIPNPPTSTVTVDTENLQDAGTRFNIRHIKKEHISGPLFNKLKRTERSGTVEKTKINENGKEVTKKWGSFYVVLTGPELLFYKDIKAITAKPGIPQGKVELKLKIQNLQFSEKADTGGKGAVLQVEDTGAPGSNITYLLRFITIEDMHTWQVALQYAKKWQNENMYSENTFNTDTGTVDDLSGDRQNIGIKLKQLLKRRPTRESLEARGILKPESVFGSSLDILCEQEKSRVPEFVFRCILAIEARGLHHNGLYRISGNQAKIQKLRLAVDENKYQLNSESMELETLTGAFKSFFKELKEPLFDEDFCSKMIEILSHRKTDKKNHYRDINLNSAKKLVSKLKPSHYETAKALIGHLHKVATFSSKNLMDVSNLSMVWGPNLYLVSGQASTKLAVILMSHNQIIDLLITNYSELFDKA